ncbi:hypothetical protein CYLTODRAFT_105900 [Cylindrobasidium torrendii FP15055 ss-10]|uniref:Uncharacterized protein n=1 Tax=Cylindrobasidium torrendii FP15055 ss-10 TaxID=1314674 RepID=A0A0D7B493_9AGAR|nr:hypothetical protein CYLTODRAFT_105900 [Cylindrobasidium torrendii FP15055 ss-10]
MDPIHSILGLSALNKWDSYKPGTRGYIAPNEDVGLPYPEDTLELNFQDTNCLKPNQAVLSGIATLTQVCPAISIFADGADEPVGFPFSKRDAAALLPKVGELGDARTTTISNDLFKIDNPKWHPSVAAATKTILAAMGFKDLPEDAYTVELADMTVQGASIFESPYVTPPAYGNHFATILVFLPSNINSVQLFGRNEAIAPRWANYVLFGMPLQTSVHAIGLCSLLGSTELTIKGKGDAVYLTYRVRSTYRSYLSFNSLTGACSDWRNIFCSWRYELSVDKDYAQQEVFFMLEADEVDNVTKLEDNDVVMVSHLAPLVKAYGFKMYFGSLVYRKECQKTFEACDQVAPESQTEAMEKDLSMGGPGIKENFIWTFTHLNGTAVAEDVGDRLNSCTDRVTLESQWVAGEYELTDREVSRNDVNVRPSSLKNSLTVTITQTRCIPFVVVTA